MTNFDINEHLKKRGINRERQHVVIDKERQIATFLLYNLSGMLVGYQTYNPNGLNRTKERSLKRYFTYVGKEGLTSKIAVWGLDTITNDKCYMFVTEGVFDIAKIHNFGEQGVAVLSNCPKHVKPWICAMGKFVIAIKDSDKAGSKLDVISDVGFSVPTKYKDIGDMPQEEANEFLSSIIKKLNLT